MTSGDSSRPAAIGIRHVALFAADLESAERFWTEVMGYQVEWRPDPDNIYLTGGSDNLALHRKTSGLAPSQGSRLDHIGIAVARAEDVDAWGEYLKAQEIPLRAAPRSHRDGSRSLYFHGPEQLLIQIIHHTPLTR